MYQPRPLRDYPSATLDALHATITALLGYQDMLPTDLSVKLSLLRDDVARATGPSPRRPVTVASRPATPARPLPSRAPRELSPHSASQGTRAQHDHPLPGRLPR